MIFFFFRASHFLDFWCLVFVFFLSLISNQFLVFLLRGVSSMVQYTCTFGCWMCCLANLRAETVESINLYKLDVAWGVLNQGWLQALTDNSFSWKTFHPSSSLVWVLGQWERLKKWAGNERDLVEKKKSSSKHWEERVLDVSTQLTSELRRKLKKKFKCYGN